MGLHSRSKGKRGEREVVALARARGLSAERTWHLAQSPSEAERRCDVLIEGARAQVKVAANGFKGLYHALDGVQLAFVRSDRRPWLAVLPARELLDVLKRSAASESSNGGRER